MKQTKSGSHGGCKKILISHFRECFRTAIDAAGMCKPAGLRETEPRLHWSGRCVFATILWVAYFSIASNLFVLSSRFFLYPAGPECFRCVSICQYFNLIWAGTSARCASRCYGELCWSNILDMHVKLYAGLRVNNVRRDIQCNIGGRDPWSR